MDAVALLKRDHRTVEQLFKRYQALGEGAKREKRAVAAQIVHELAVHAAIEEQFLYPLVRERDLRLQKLALEALEEHHVAKWLLNEIDSLDVDSERYDAKVKVLMENVRHHVEEEEQDLFPLMERLMAKEELDALGAVLESSKVLAPTRPHPMAPDTPPGNIAAGLVAKVMDTGRDAYRSITLRRPLSARKATKKSRR